MYPSKEQKRELDRVVAPMVHQLVSAGIVSLLPVESCLFPIRKLYHAGVKQAIDFNRQGKMPLIRSNTAESCQRFHESQTPWWEQGVKDRCWSCNFFGQGGGGVQMNYPKNAVQKNAKKCK